MTQQAFVGYLTRPWGVFMVKVIESPLRKVGYVNIIKKIILNS